MSFLHKSDPAVGFHIIGALVDRDTLGRDDFARAIAQLTDRGFVSASFDRIVTEELAEIIRGRPELSFGVWTRIVNPKTAIDDLYFSSLEDAITAKLLLM